MDRNLVYWTSSRNNRMTHIVEEEIEYVIRTYD